MHKLATLKIWDKAMTLTTKIYKATMSFLKEETYGLTSQLRRAAVSAPSNTAEGAGRNSKNEFRYFPAIANGSSYGLQTQLIIAQNLNLLTSDIVTDLLQDIDELQKMNYRLQQHLLKVQNNTRR